MATVTIDTVEYAAYADVAFADNYLAADMLRSSSWAALTTDNKGRGLVTAYRLMLRLPWTDGPPDIDAPPAGVQEANSLLAADITAKPAMGDSADTSSNVKSVGAGSAKVEFFSPKSGGLLPPAVLELLRPYLGGSGDDASGYGTAFGSCAVSRFDPYDWALMSNYGADWQARDWGL